MEFDKYKLTPEQHQSILNDIFRYTFNGKKGVEEPQVFIIGGQPGAGKTNIIAMSEKEFKDGNFVTINGDDYRVSHPMAIEIFKKHDKDFAKYTDHDVRDWTEKIFDKAIEGKYNVIFEGTMRTEQICSTIKRLQNEGYEVNIRVAAVNELESKASIYQRYEDQLEKTGMARFTPHDSHDEAYSGMMKTLKTIESESLYDRLEVYRRNGEMVFESSKDNPQRGAVEKIQEIRDDPWSIEKYQEFINKNEKLIEKMTQRGEEPEHTEFVKGLNQQAKKLLVERDRQICEKIQEVKNAPDLAKLNLPLEAGTMYNTYAKEVMSRNNNVWEKGGTDNEVIKELLNKGISTQRTQEVLQNSPAFVGLSRQETLKRSYQMVSDIAKSPEIKKTISMFKGIER